MSLRIAHAAPFEGKPGILTPSVVGFSAGKPFLYRIPVIGERPIRTEVSGLPDGLSLQDGILRGQVQADGEWTVEITSTNALGSCRRSLRLSAGADHMLQTPLLGFTSWNAYARKVSQDLLEGAAQQLVDLGIADYGYGYVNLDSGWQMDIGGEYDAIRPNPKFPDMKGMYDRFHSLGLRGGIYSTPMLTAWGCPDEYESIPGCTRGEPDPLRTNVMGGVGMEHLEENNVRQWEAWGVDYLKYDWNPCDPYTADPMKQALLHAGREIAFCVTVHAAKAYGHYWMKNCSSWRDQCDSMDNWETVVKILSSVKGWKPYVCPGHFFDLDMLEIGAMRMNYGVSRLTDEEQLTAYTMRAFFASPIQLSCRLEKLTETEFDIICNEEVIAINQDALADFPDEVRLDENVRIYSRRLENGDIAFALFNMQNEERTEMLSLPAASAVRDVWMKEDLPAAEQLACLLPPHGVRLFRVTPA